MLLGMKVLVGRKFLWILTALLFGFVQSRAQLLPPNQPEQDACHALLLCGNTFHTPYSYQGNGTVLDLTGTPCDIPNLSTGEDNSMWLRLEVNTSGTIVFTLTPVNSSDDYDWAVLNITNGNCQHLSSSNVVRCNFNRNVPVTNNGVTGLTMTATETGVPANTQGHSYCRYINAQAGDVYLIMINNFGVNGGPSSGFTIDFSGSTATFNNTGLPKLDSIDNPCTSSQYVDVQLNKPVLCSSIASNGSDFLLTGGVGAVSSAVGINCSGGQGYTSTIRVHFLSTLAPGQYVLHAQTGTDNNTLLDLCENALALPDSLVFTVPNLHTTVYQQICSSQLPYHWNGLIVTHGGANAAQATFLTAMNCDSVVTLNLQVTDTLKATDTVVICPQQLPYHWNGITVNTGGAHVAQYFTHSSSGCDSLTYLNLNVQYPHQTTFHLEGCGEVIFNNHTYTQSGQYQDTVISSHGCDSVFADLHIIVHPVHTTTAVLDTAGCGSVYFHGTVYDSSTTLLDTLHDRFGCDSVYNITHIKVYPNHYVAHYYYLTDCYKVVFEGRTYYQDVTLTDTFQNVLGCDSAVRIVNIHPEGFQIALSATPDSPAVGVHLRLTTHANDLNYHILSWLPQANFPMQTAYQQLFVAEDSGIFTYSVVGQNEDGCLDTASITLKVEKLYPDVFMPNAFSPNGDGLNDVFKPYFINKSGYQIKSFRVFNRYGEMVYAAAHTTKAGWDGRYRNGLPADSGVYYYNINILFVNGKAIHLKGDVTLIR